MNAQPTQSAWKHVPVRRLARYIEESIHRDTHWAVFQPNSEPTWDRLRVNVEAFMNGLFRRGMLAGRTATEAFYVKCGSETMTRNEILQGLIRIEIGFAPLQAGEFIAVTIQQGTAHQGAAAIPQQCDADSAA